LQLKFTAIVAARLSGIRPARSNPVSVVDNLKAAVPPGSLASLSAGLVPDSPKFPRALLQKILRICELPHIGAAKKLRPPIGKLNAT
jgi:hypothetical protein